MPPQMRTVIKDCSSRLRDILRAAWNSDGEMPVKRMGGPDGSGTWKQHLIPPTSSVPTQIFV